MEYLRLCISYNWKYILIRYYIELCLLPVGWGSDQRGFGEEPGMKTQALNLIRSIRTVMRSKIIFYVYEIKWLHRT